MVDIVTGVTERLLQYWNSPDRERRLFFCQREAVEIVVYLTEIMPKNPKRDNHSLETV